MGVLTQEKERLVFRFNGETVVVEPWGKNSLRVRAVMMGEIRDTDFALLPVETDIACGPAEITFSQTVGSIQNGKLRAEITISDWTKEGRLAFYNEKGELLLRETGDGGALHWHARRFHPLPGGDFRLTASFDGNDGERLYGMGQYQQEFMNLAGCTLELAQRNSQASVPFLLSDKGYGFFWHNPAIGRAAFNRNRYEWTAESSKQLDYWITAGDTPAEILEAYTAVTGRAPMMPEYGLGFWQCKLRYWNQEQLLSVAREYKRRNLPVDVIVCDFFHWPHLGDYRFDSDFFPDPEAMARELESMGMKLMVSVWPQVGLDSENYEEMRDKGLLVKSELGVNIQMRVGGDSTFFDATNPETRRYVWDKCKQNYFDKGVTLFWLDEAEPEFSGYDFGHYRYHLGPVLQMGNLYPQHYSRAFYEGMRAEGNEDIVNLVRCAWAGSQRYGALVWSGDIYSNYEDFRRQLCAGLQMGLSGIPWWTTDIGGFSDGDPSDENFRELFIRWFQWGTFCPVMRLHGDRMPSSPVYRPDGTPAAFGTGADNEVWSYGEQATPILEKYLRLREALRPYTREVMRKTHETGAPVMRAMLFDFPQDKVCWDLRDQYMFGPDLLVAPIVWEHALSRRVYLPEGAVWTSLHDGRRYDGGQWILAEAPLDVIPVFARNGQCGGDGLLNDLIGKI